MAVLSIIKPVMCFLNKIIQFNAALAITGAICGISK